MLLDWHSTVAPTKAVSDYDVKLVQRLLCYTRAGLWLSDGANDWHYPLLVTLREKGQEELADQSTRQVGRET